MVSPAKSDKPLSRREVVALVRDEFGFPLTLSAFQQQCARGEGPPPAARWGNRLLYRSDDVRRWALERAQVQEARA